MIAMFFVKLSSDIFTKGALFLLGIISFYLFFFFIPKKVYRNESKHYITV